MLSTENVPSRVGHQKSCVTPSSVLDTVIVDVVTTKIAPCGRTREDRLDGSNILIVCCGLDGLDSKKFTFVRAKDLGVRVYLIEDGENSLARSMEDEGIIEKFIRVDMAPRASLMDDVMKAINTFRGEVTFHGCCTFWDDSVALMARIQEALKLPGNSVKSIDIAHNKYLTRIAMEKAGLPTPKNMLLTCESDAERAVIAVGVPCVIKPMSGGSSLGVLKVEEIEQLVPTYRRCVQMLNEFYEEGELMGLTFQEDKDSNNRNLVIEEYLDGDEVDVDILLNNGEVTYSVVADDWPQIQPWFAEMGNNLPSVLSHTKQQQLTQMAVQCLAAIGLTNGVFHTELKYTTKNGPRIIEVNPRMGGGPVWQMHKLAFGVDLVEEQLYAACGIPVTPTYPRKPVCFVSCGEKFYNRSMNVSRELLEVVKALTIFPNVIESSALLEEGEKIVGIDDGFPTRVARFIVTSKQSSLAAERYVRELLDVCDITVRREQENKNNHPQN